MSKETYISVKRDLYQCQKRPISVSKRTYISVKRDLYLCQKRLITVSKETEYFERNAEQVPEASVSIET